MSLRAIFILALPFLTRVVIESSTLKTFAVTKVSVIFAFAKRLTTSEPIDEVLIPAKEVQTGVKTNLPMPKFSPMPVRELRFVFSIEVLAP